MVVSPIHCIESWGGGILSLLLFVHAVLSGVAGLFHMTGPMFSSLRLMELRY